MDVSDEGGPVEVRPWVQLAFVDVFGASCSMLIPSSRWDEAVERGVAFDGSALEGRARYLESDMRLLAQPVGQKRSTTSGDKIWKGDG